MFDKTHYTNGQKVFEFTGNKLTFFFKTGIVKAEGIFEDGQMEGEWKFYRENGKLWQISAKGLAVIIIRQAEVKPA